MDTSKELRMKLLHDLKKIAIAINELVRDLDKVERNDSVDSNNGDRSCLDHNG